MRGLHRLAVVLAFALALGGCWRQSDLITIGADGAIDIVAEVTMTERRFSREEVERLSAEFVESLRQSGWQVEKRWVSDQIPYRLTVTGRGSLQRIRDASDFYDITRVAPRIYEFRFFPATVQGERSSRSIEFRLAPGVRVLDEQEREVRAIPHVFGNLRYRVLLP